jgi:hypothetical protein
MHGKLVKITETQYGRGARGLAKRNDRIRFGAIAAETAADKLKED